MIEQPVPQHLVLVTPTTGEFDSRSYRIARACIERGHRVTVVARWRDGLPFEETHPVGFRLLRVRAAPVDALPGWLAGAARTVTERIPAARPKRSATGQPSVVERALQRVGFPFGIRAQRRNAVRQVPHGDLYHGMAFMGIPVALGLGRRDRAPVVYDARDVYLEARNLARMPAPVRSVVGRFERGWATAARRVVTVNDAYADVLAARWPVPRPLVVMNCSYRYTPAEPRERRFHDRLGLDPGTRVVLYHGGFSPWRGIEQLVEAITLVPGATLVLMGYGVLEPTLRGLEADPSTNGAVRVMDAVPPDELLDWVAAADVAAMPIQGDTLNHRLTTPNKLFEAMAAGVPAVVSDLPGMRAVVEDAGSGLLVDPADPAAIAGAIRQLVELDENERQAWRDRCLAAAHATYNWETQVERLLDAYSDLTGRRW